MKRMHRYESMLIQAKRMIKGRGVYVMRIYTIVTLIMLTPALLIFIFTLPMNEIEWAILMILLTLALAAFVVVYIMYRKTIKPLSIIEEALSDYRYDQDITLSKLISLLIKYGHLSHNLSHDWVNYIDNAYYLLNRGHLAFANTIEIDNVQVAILQDKTKEFYIEQDVAFKTTNIIQVLAKDQINELKHLLNKFSIDLFKPYKVETFKFRKKLKSTTLIYPVIGEILNRAKMKPIGLGNVNVWIREDYLHIEGDVFIVEIDINGKVVVDSE